MRIAYVNADRGIPARGTKGASVHVRAITAALEARGHPVTLLCARLGDGPDEPAVHRVVEVGVDESEWRQVVGHLLAAAKVDAVVERYSLGSGVAGPACAEHGTPHLLEVNAPFVLEAARHRGLQDVDRWLRWEREVFGATDHVVVVSEQLRRYVERVWPTAAVTVIGNGVDLARFGPRPALDLGTAPGTVVIGFVGSMKSWHGVDDLLVAFGRLPAAPPACLVLAGAGPCEPALRAEVDARHLGDRVRFLGPLPHEQVPSLLRAIDIGVAPYRPSDDFYFSPLKILEYMATGVPTAYPNIDDLPAMVGGGGIAYAAGDVAALRAALERLIGDAALRVALGREAARLARRFSWDGEAGRIEALIASRMASLP